MTSSACEDVDDLAATIQRTTSRNRLGPADATIQIVGFIDYDCTLCRDICQQIDAVMQSDRSIAFTIRHYPLCRPCNQRTGLPACRKWSACDKAAFAEAAGQIGGIDAFFAAHRALIGREPPRSSDWLATKLNLPPDQLQTSVASDIVRERIAADIAEADRLGLLSTPMVFVNGVEIRSTALPGVIRKTVAAIRSAEEPWTAPQASSPPAAVEKMISDWQLARPEPTNAGGAAWPIGRSGETALVLWADPLDDRTPSLDRQLRALTVRHPHVVYRFRPLPSSNASDDAARLIDAAELRAGPIGFWALQRWILENRLTFSRIAVETLLDRLGLDTEAFRRDAGSPEVTARLDQCQAEAAARDGWVLGPPMLYVAGRWLPIAPTTEDGKVADAVDCILARSSDNL
jgi:protein-disulfide isomerase